MPIVAIFFTETSQTSVSKILAPRIARKIGYCRLVRDIIANVLRLITPFYYVYYCLNYSKWCHLNRLISRNWSRPSGNTELEGDAGGYKRKRSEEESGITAKQFANSLKTTKSP